ncbi:MAG TPA: hypothetical protein VKY19_28000 [Ktedonosporobacter sp.]|nr:hypothetical protein [Ktedonosporobacter sp.]
MRRAKSSQADRASARHCPYPSDPALGKIIGGTAAGHPSRRGTMMEAAGRSTGRDQSGRDGRMNGMSRGNPSRLPYRNIRQGRSWTAAWLRSTK